MTQPGKTRQIALPGPDREARDGDRSARSSGRGSRGLTDADRDRRSRLTLVRAATSVPGDVPDAAAV
jgi:hypothetical protein